MLLATLASDLTHLLLARGCFLAVMPLLDLDEPSGQNRWKAFLSMRVFPIRWDTRGTKRFIKNQRFNKS